MIVQSIRAELLSIPELASWPEMVSIIERPVLEGTIPCWEHPVLACRAVGGEERQALPGAVAIFCLLYSIHLVDDLLDSDPKGLHHIYGEGRVANYALALQAAASATIERASLAGEVRAAIHERLAQAALSTAHGQNLDLEENRGEADYWRVVEAKTPPLFSAALEIGALLGGAPEAVARSLNQLGFLLGKTIQVSDDLRDAFEKPAAPDWLRQQSSLPIIYSMTASHPDRERFCELLSCIDDPSSLEEAQEILVRSGAVSFCAYHMLELHRAATELIRQIPLVDAEPLNTLVGQYVGPLRRLLQSIGVEDLEPLLP